MKYFLFRSKPKLEVGPIEAALAKCKIKDEKILTDYTVLSQDGARFPCHRIFLATQSPPLMAKMTLDMKEKRESEMRLEYEQDVVRHFVDYFYTGMIPQETLEENLESFLALADFYDLAGMKLQTEKAAIKKMTVGDMLEMNVLANLYRADQLKVASEFLIQNNKESLKDQDLSGYPANVIADILRLIC